VNIPAVVVATKNLDILVLFLIADLVSAAVLPPILLGLVPALYFLNGFDVVVGGLGGVFPTSPSTTIRRPHLPAGFFTVFLFGLVYYDGNASAAGGLLILKDGLYADDWSAFGAFVAAYVDSFRIYHMPSSLTSVLPSSADPLEVCFGQVVHSLHAWFTTRSALASLASPPPFLKGKRSTGPNSQIKPSTGVYCSQKNLSLKIHPTITKARGSPLSRSVTYIRSLSQILEVLLYIPWSCIYCRLQDVLVCLDLVETESIYLAIHSTSTKTSFGRRATSTADLAGACWSKCLA
jgi:hypothetical protein